MSTLDVVGWICGLVMFGAFSVEGLASRFVLRDGRYDLKDTLVNLVIMGGYVLSRVLVGAVVTLALLAIYDLTPLRWSMGSWWHWVALFFVEDFSYYWSHRASHRFRFMWASHAVHHNSPVLNLSTGLRNSWVGGLIDWPFWVPIVALGFHPLALAAVVGVASAWDFMTHTPYIGKLRWLDPFFNTPSNHRVHHAKNPQYVDKNLGGALIIWDRMFGTYAREDAKPVYGIDEMPQRPHNPFYLELYLWWAGIRAALRRPKSNATPEAVDVAAV